MASPGACSGTSNSPLLFRGVTGITYGGRGTSPELGQTVAQAYAPLRRAGAAGRDYAALRHSRHSSGTFVEFVRTRTRCRSRGRNDSRRDGWSGSALADGARALASPRAGALSGSSALRAGVRGTLLRTTGSHSRLGRTVEGHGRTGNRIRQTGTGQASPGHRQGQRA